MGYHDLERVRDWRNHPNIRRFMLTRHEITHQEHSQWFERVSTDPGRRLLIAELNELPIGFVQFSDVGPGAVSHWGFYAAPDAPKGSGRQLGIAAISFAFGQLKLHKICGRALCFNEASVRFHDSLGFRREGILRDQERIDGAYHDVICFGLLVDEWPIKGTEGTEKRV